MVFNILERWASFCLIRFSYRLTQWRFQFTIAENISRYLKAATIGPFRSKIGKVPAIFNVGSREKTRKVRENWSQQLENKQVPKRDQGLGKRSLQASHTSCKCFMETPRNSVKIKLGIKVTKLVKSIIRLGSQRNWSMIRSFSVSETNTCTSYCWIRSPYRP